MKLELQKLVDIVKLLLIFSVLTFFFYGAIIWVVEKIEPHQRYDNPKGKAVKVIQMIDSPPLSTFEDVKNRLIFYYWFGE